MFIFDFGLLIFYCEVGRLFSLVCIFVIFDKMDVEGEFGMYM